MKLNFKVENIVMQSTSFCNLNCSYCYLPNRDRTFRMTREITQELAEQIKRHNEPVKILWHAGEPTSSGIKHFTEISEPFHELEKLGIVSHRIQTNASLINDDWIGFFKERKFQVGVSIDGPEWANKNRVNWNGRDSYKDVYSGIQKIKQADIPFGVLAVVHDMNICHPEELYSYFVELGCSWIGFNVEEKLGVHMNSQTDSALVKNFFEKIYNCWLKNPKLEIREFADIVRWFEDVLSGVTFETTVNYYDLFPTIGYNGDFVFLAPEFLSDKPISTQYNFIVGNVLRDNLFDRAQNCDTIDYVREYVEGVGNCKSECEYFSMCKGGTGGNKFFESGRLNITETYFCINSVKIPSQIIFKQLNL